MMGETCVYSGCGNPPAAVQFPDLRSPHGSRYHGVCCVAHELSELREEIARLTYRDSQLTMAAITAGVPTDLAEEPTT